MSDRHLLSEDDMQNDLRMTMRDVDRLRVLVENLRAFITDTDQDRGHYRMTLMHFEADLGRGQKLIEVIRGRLAGLKEQP